MKKVMILSVVALTLSLGMPQLLQATNVKSDASVTQQKDVKYAEITVDQIPEAVSKALEKDYVGYKTDRVFLGDDGTYKLEISKGDNKSVLFFTDKGELLKSEKAVNNIKTEVPMK